MFDSFFLTKVGMIAKQELKQGSTIIREDPILLITPTMKEVSWWPPIKSDLPPDKRLQRHVSAPRISKAVTRGEKIGIDALRPRTKLHQV